MRYLPKFRHAGSALDCPVSILDSEAGTGRGKILLIGDDPILLYSRRLVFENEGYVVASLKSDTLIHEDELRTFDVIVLCHSIPDQVMTHILEMLWRSAPDTPVLWIARFDRPIGASKQYTEVAANPAALLASVSQQLANHQPQH